MSLKFIGAIGAALMAFAPLTATAQMAPDHSQSDPRGPGHNQGRPDQGRPDQGRPDQGRPGQDRPGMNNPGHGPGHGPGPGYGQGNNRPGPSYGNWDNRWGARPGRPPSHWGNQGDWYRHVRACQRKYRSYNASTDVYYSGRRARRCRL
ncbi:hypothetical protein BH10PSE12_BH10PSE12_03580 [soil metagenome]